MANDSPLPSHIAIIMDGNGRWAVAKGMTRTAGHKEGLEAAKRIIRRASELGVRYVTLYTFSTENWTRAQEEVSFLMNLIAVHLRREMDFYRTNDIRVVHSGDRSALPPSILREIDDVCADTAAFTGLTVNLAINYGGRDEIVRAVRRIVAESGGPPAPEQVTEALIASKLDHPEIPDVDLMVRTGGDTRISNFLLWQSSYSELYFSPKFWPDWQPGDLDEAVRSFGNRERKFGGIK